MLEGRRGVLAVYIVWHPKFTEGPALADWLFTRLSSNPDVPCERGLGIPVRFRTAAAGHVPVDVPFDRAEHTGVVILVDDEMAADETWDSYIAGLLRGSATGAHMVIPVALTDKSFNVGGGIDVVNFLRVFDANGPEQRRLRLLNRVMHDLRRLLDPENAVQVFISHAKEDGLVVAEAVRRYLHENTGIADFFDATAIPDGSRFGDVILKAVGQSALLVIHTDHYSSREWCRLEVLEAKRRRTPIMVLSAAQDETRSFPYLGNVPVVRWTASADAQIDAEMEHVLERLLCEILRCCYFPKRLEAICRECGLSHEGPVLFSPPELVTALQLRVEAGEPPTGRVLYPDPPLGVEELRLLRALDPTLVPLTPTLLVAS
jgi:hypothetical protein